MIHSLMMRFLPIVALLLLLLVSSTSTSAKTTTTTTTNNNNSTDAAHNDENNNDSNYDNGNDYNYYYYLKPFSLELYDFPSTGRGVRTLVDKSPGDVLIRIPVQDTITVSSTIKNNNKNKNSHSSSFALQQYLIEQQQQQLRLQQEKEKKVDVITLAEEEQLLALALLLLLRLPKEDDDNNNNNDIHSYVSTALPREFFGVGTLPEDLFQDEALFCLPRCYQEFFQATRNTLLDDFVTKHYTGINSSNNKNDDDDNNNNNDDNDEIVTRSELIWAFSMVRSRSLAVPELSSSSDGTTNLALIPGLDMFNHNFDAGTTLQLVVDDNVDDDDNDDAFWTLVSSKSYTAGDQIFLSYGDEKDNWKLLQTYGFAVHNNDNNNDDDDKSAAGNNNNPNAYVFWTWEDVLDAASQVRPQMFTSRVHKSLLRHPQLVKTYMALTEHRAIFSWDGNLGIPRESLQTGLSLLTNLAIQLGFSKNNGNDDSLQSDVMNRLIENRLVELEKCRRRRRRNQGTDRSNIELPDKWKPFWEATQRNLAEEEKYLKKAAAAAAAAANSKGASSEL